MAYNNEGMRLNETLGDLILEEVGKILEEPIFWIFLGLGIVAVAVKNHFEAN